MVLPIYPFLTQEAGGSLAVFQKMTALMYFTQLLILPLGGELIDRFAQTRLSLIAGALLLAGSFVAPWLVHSVPVLYAARAVEGIALGLFTPAAGIAVMNGRQGKAGELYGRFHGLRNIARIGAPAVGSFVAGLYGKWNTLLVAAGLTLLIAAAIAASPGQRAARRDRRPAAKGLRRLPELRLAGARILTTTVQGLLQPVIPYVLQNSFGVRDSSVGYMYSIAGVLALTMPVYFGRIADRRGEGTPIVALSSIGTVALLGLAAARQLPVLVLLFGIGMGVTVSATSISHSMAVEMAGDHRQGSVLARVEFAGTVGRVIGPLLGVPVYARFGWTGICVAGAVSSLLIGVLLFASIGMVARVPEPELTT
jgi:MFS family permease